MGALPPRARTATRSRPTPTPPDSSLLFINEKEAHFNTKKRNFYAALKYIQHYPAGHEMPSTLGMTHPTFYSQVQPTIFQMARHIDFLDWNLRLWDYNHTEHFPERVLTTFDGFPISVCHSSNKWVARLTKSKKYNAYILKADLGIMLGPGFPVNYSLQLGVRNDSRMWNENLGRRCRMYPWE